MSITRLTGGLTPADGDDPRTFPTIFNSAADLAEGTASSLSTLTPRVTALEGASTVLKFYTTTKTDTFVFTSVAAGGGVDIPDLTISDVAVSDAANSLLIIGFVGVVASSGLENAVGMAVSDGSNLLSIGGAAGVRSRVTSGGASVAAGASSSASVANSQHITILHTPGDTTARTYRLRLINASANTRTIYLNRTSGDVDTELRTRGACALHIMEIAG